MSNSIYRPYFYIIQHINSGVYYAGAKYAKNANPDNLLRPDGYQTSSKVIQQIILDEGLESFVIRKIKVFETGGEALEYESRFLRKVNASFNEFFLNRSNNSMSTLNIDYEKTKQTNLIRYGFENILNVPEFQEKKNQTMIKNFGVSHALQSKELKEKYKQTCLEKYGVEHSFQSKEVIEKRNRNNLEKYGAINVFQNEDIKEKIKQANLKNFGVEYAMQSEEIKEKSKQTLLRKYGIENISQSPEIKEKKRQTYNGLSNRPIVSEIKKYKDKFKFKLGGCWIYKKQEVLETILEELKKTYGELN